MGKKQEIQLADLESPKESLREALSKKIFDVFFSETRPLLGDFLEKIVFCPLEMSNTCKSFQNPKIGEK